MKPQLTTLTLGLWAAILGLILALVWALRILRRGERRGLVAELKAALTGLPSLGFATRWPVAEGVARPDLFAPSVIFLAAAVALIGGYETRIAVYGYGFTLMLGFGAAIALASARARSRGIDPNHVLDLGMLAVAFGVLGARIFYYIQFYDDKFADQPWWKFIAVWEGGGVYYGGLILAVLVSSIYARRRGYRVLALGDLVAPVLALGLSFGRVGCFLNGCCWGKVCDPDSFAAVRFPRSSFAWWRHVEPYLTEQEMASFAEGSIGYTELLARIPLELQTWSLPVYPVQLLAWALAIGLTFLIVVFERRFARREGQAFALFFVMYALIRFSVETIRGDHDQLWSWSAWSPTPSQQVGLFIFPIALALFVLISLKGRPLTGDEAPAPSRA